MFLYCCCVNPHIVQTLKEAVYQYIVIIRNYSSRPNTINMYKKYEFAYISSLNVSKTKIVQGINKV